MDEQQISLDFERVMWPDQLQFPLNIKSQQRKVSSVVYQDIEDSTHYIILTGFTSLSNLVDLFGSKEYKNLKKVKILLGFEPNLKGRKKYVNLKLEKEIKDYWLKAGFSIMLGGAVLNLIDKIEKGFVEVKFLNKLHAKIYVGNKYAILGSSNFSYNGLNIQDEANIRVSNFIGSPKEKEQYDAIKQIAESYFEQATPYKEKLIELLKEIIKKVTWEEALARAIAEILEGHWLQDYKEILVKLERNTLWPTQWQGIAQAVTILQRHSNVLIADPTGAGKTKLCVSLILSLKQWLYENGKHHNTNSLVVCPPLVKDKWGEEFRSLRRIDNIELSMGLLSNAGGRNQKKVLEDLSLANILVIDEAHNYLSPDSKRTNLIKENRADFKMLITATPISRKVEDLLRLIELLDIDNLSDEHFEIYKELYYKPYLAHREQNIKDLRNFISKFTVRRTKKYLNKEIDKNPAAYINKRASKCRFPKQISKTYRTLETNEDVLIVREINQLASSIKGITYLTDFKKPDFEMSNPESIASYLTKRFHAGKALSVYMVRAKLRSSHVALVEHIEGSAHAMDYFSFEGKSKETGDKLTKLEQIIRRGKLPRKYSLFKNEFFPSWLNDKEEYLKACKEEYDIYKKISLLAKKLSGRREYGKVAKLKDISKKHANILAFDGTVITLYYFKKLFEQNHPEQKILVASGSEKDNESRKVMEEFNIQSNSTERYIALCSDKMAESIDLQKASCMMLLDMPSVLRIVEQRIGRVDRMDSQNAEIEIFWPEDSEEYSLKADERLIVVNDMVEQIYGSNFEVPEVLKKAVFSKTDSTKAMIEEYTEFVEKDVSWSGIHDSFQPIVSLKEGPTALIDEKTYEQLKNVSAEVRTRVSFLESKGSGWCFLALRGDHIRSPKWYFIDHNENIHTEFEDICMELRNVLGGNIQNLEWNDAALKKYVILFKRKERTLLPPKKKRSLEVAEYIIRKRLDSKNKLEMKDSLQMMLDMLTGKAEEIVDFERLADDWITVFQPYLDQKRKQGRKKRVLYNLHEIKKESAKIPLSCDILNQFIENSIIAQAVDERVAACIIGVNTILD